MLKEYFPALVLALFLFTDSTTELCMRTFTAEGATKLC